MNSYARERARLTLSIGGACVNGTRFVAVVVSAAVAPMTRQSSKSPKRTPSRKIHLPTTLLTSTMSLPPTESHSHGNLPTSMASSSFLRPEPPCVQSVNGY